MVIPVGKGDTQKMLVIRKNAEGKVSQEEAGLFRFVPFLGGVDRKS
jgi:protein-L-isoaspartate O-methyltransferase